MFAKYQEEMQKLTGKRKHEQPIVKENNQLSELEVIHQVEQLLKEKKGGGSYGKHLNGSFVDNHNGSFYRDLEMLTLMKKDKENRSKKTADAYPMDYQTYKKKLESKKKSEEEDFDSNSLSLKHDEMQIQAHTKRGIKKRKIHSIETSLPPVKYKNKYYDSAQNQWRKFEFRHPGNFV